MDKLLDVQNLSVSVKNITLLDDLSFSVTKNTVLGIFGKSGSGKSLLCKSLFDLQHRSLTRSGNILYNGEKITHQPKVKNLLGKQVSIVFQNSQTSLNPMLTIKKHLQPLCIQNEEDLLHRVGFVDTKVMKKYPHELSGGEASRIGLALALATNPELLILDEPFASIDHKLKQQFQTIFNNLVKNNQTTIILVTHSHEILNNLAKDFIFLEGGKIIEHGSVTQFFNPKNNILLKLNTSYKKLYL